MAEKKIRNIVLVTEADRPEENKHIRITQVAVGALSPNPEQPRTEYDEDAMNELSASIRENGVLQPLVVERNPNGGYNIIYGHRRWLAAQRAELDTVPCIVRNVESDLQRLILALSENLIRHDMSELDTGRSYLKLQNEHGMSQQTIADKIGVKQQSVSRAIQLATAPAEVQELLEVGTIAPAAARAIIAIEKPKEIKKALAAVSNGKTTVKEIAAAIAPAKKDTALEDAIRLVNKALIAGKAEIVGGKIVATQEPKP